MTAMQGMITGTSFMRSLSRATAPWLSVDAVADGRRQEHCKETGRFLSGAVTDIRREPQENIEKCMSCPHPECRNCLSHRSSRGRKRRQTVRELEESVRIRRCEEV